MMDLKQLVESNMHSFSKIQTRQNARGVNRSGKIQYQEFIRNKAEGESGSYKIGSDSIEVPRVERRIGRGSRVSRSMVL